MILAKSSSDLGEVFILVVNKESILLKNTSSILNEFSAPVTACSVLLPHPHAMALPTSGTHVAHVSAMYCMHVAGEVHCPNMTAAVFGSHIRYFPACLAPRSPGSQHHELGGMLRTRLLICKASGVLSPPPAHSLDSKSRVKRSGANTYTLRPSSAQRRRSGPWTASS